MDIFIYIYIYPRCNEIIARKRYNHKPYFFFPSLFYDSAKKGKVSGAAEIQQGGIIRTRAAVQGGF